MDETKIIQCSCGQESQLVFLEGVWHFDVTRHGNGEPCEGRCFNCRAPLKDEKLFPDEQGKAPATAEGPEETEGPKEISMSMKRVELIAIAENSGIEIPTGAKKADIIELLEQARATEEQEPEDE